MQIDKNKLKSFLSMDEDELKKTISKAAKAGGIEEDVSQMLNAENIKNVKEKISGISEQDLVNMINSFGSDKLELLVKNIKNKT